jgi:glutamate/tyrosine decarboxylase-like PLP-dependent enzyme
VPLGDGAELADSWSTDAHKWLNTPYDCGIALVRDAEAHRRAFHGGATYLPGDVGVPNPFDLAPELSRRARGFALWAALRELGRRGVADLVERCCAHAARFAAGLAALDGVEVMNEVVLNQLVVRFRDPSGTDDDAYTRDVIARVIAEGTCYPTATTWRGRAAMRISVSNWSTDDDDVARSVAAIASVLAARRGQL